MNMTSAIKIDGKAVKATPTGLKIGAKGLVQHPSLVFAELSHGEARRLRKTLRKGGFAGHARHSRKVA